MPKPVKRLPRRPKSSRGYGRDSGTPAGDERLSSGLAQAKNRSSIADNKCLRLAALMFLPVVFGVFGLLMFPPSFDFTGNDVAKVVTDTNSNNTGQEQILPSQKTNVHGAGGSKAKAKRDSAQQSQKKEQQQQQKRDEPSSSSKKGSKVPSAHSSGIETFEPTFLASLDIREVIVEGKTVKPVELTKNKSESPVKVYMFEGFLSDAECAGLMRVHRQHVTEADAKDPIVCFDSIHTLRKHLLDAGKDVAVSRNDFTEGTSCVNASFSSQLKTFLTWSYSTAFYPGESKFSSLFQERVFKATGLKPSNGGKFQITSYPEGIGYKTHTDCTLNNPDKRDRFGTILVYLQDVQEGGETQFPELGVSVQPRRGRAIVWNNMNSSGDCEPVSVHTAAPVVSGHKFIIQRWYYHENFYQLGKRSPEPDVPAREPGQARVSCDEYEHGSCRWYDEWNFEHILEYRKWQGSLH